MPEKTEEEEFLEKLDKMATKGNHLIRSYIYGNPPRNPKDPLPPMGDKED